MCLLWSGQEVTLQCVEEAIDKSYSEVPGYDIGRKTLVEGTC